MQSLLLTYIAGGIVLALLALPFLAGKVKPNLFYGLRIPATLENPVVWYAANKFFAKRLLVVALIEVIAAVGLYFPRNMNTERYTLSVFGVFIVTFVIAMFQSLRYIKSIR
jgi:uncharacterized membrane protein